MSTTIRIDEVAQMVVAENAKVQKMTVIAARAAAMRLRKHLVQRTDELKLVDTGLYKNSFKVSGTSVTNEAPHAGIIELGARPHAVSMHGIQSLAGWVRRKLGVKDEKRALAIAYAIAEKIKKHGQKPHYVMRDSLPEAKKFFGEELARIMKKSMSGAK